MIVGSREYHNLHRWVRKNKGRATVCKECGSTSSVQHANISGSYKKELDDFIELCKKCHARRDWHRIRTNNPQELSSFSNKRPYGTMVLSAVLDEDKVFAIRHLYREGWHSQDNLAKTFGVSQKQISRIVRGEAWKQKEKTVD